MKANKAQEDYPIHFRDKIDEYLFHEHGILAGCCSSIESLKYSVAREVAEKLNDAFIEKACEKLEKYMYDNLMFQGRLHRKETIETFIENFKKYMKGE